MYNSLGNATVFNDKGEFVKVMINMMIEKDFEIINKVFDEYCEKVES